MKRLLPLVFVLCAAQAFAQSWPSRPVRVIVPLGAGGFADVPARILAPRLAEQIGGTFYVENRPGAGSTIGADFVAKSDPDGHTLLFTATPHVISAHLYRSLRYKPLEDFAPVALTASRKKAAFFPLLSTRWTFAPSPERAQAITMPGKPPPEPKSTQVRAFGAKARS